MKLYLVGMMGSGKTAIGSLIAQRLGWRFVDVDAEIVRAEGRSVAQIFEERGEARFRALESLAVAGACAEAADAVVSLGGGAVLDPASRRRLKETGRIVWLRAAPPVLAARIGALRANGGESSPKNDEERPLLKGLTGEARVARLAEILAERAPLYEEVADLAIDTEDRSPEAVADALERWIAGSRAVRVDLGPRAYDVILEPGGLARLGRVARKAGLGPGRCAVVTDETVLRLHLDRAARSLRSAGFDATVLVLPPGEKAKTLSEVERLAEACAEARLDRTSVVFGVGGGAVTDVAGFLAAIYMRGLPLVLAPTTLLGMVDAAIGGKTGVNLSRGKNLVGAFYQPRLVLADPEVLATLPAEEWLSGLGEVLKYALIGPADLYAAVEERLPALCAGAACAGPKGDPARGAERAAALARPPGDGNGKGSGGPAVLADVIARCVAVKAAIVAEDERETGGGRKALNFGHTIGHAIEAAAGYGAIPHGAAVVLGMRAALFLSRRAGVLPAAEEERLQAFLARFPQPMLPAGLADEAILEPLLRDKKFAKGKLLFVLLRGQGVPLVDQEVAVDDVKAALASIR